MRACPVPRPCHPPRPPCRSRPATRASGPAGDGFTPSRATAAAGVRRPNTPPPPPTRAPAPPASSVPIEPDDVLDVEVTQVVDPIGGDPSASAAGARRTGRAAAGRDPGRRVRRYEASIIDAEIISSTVLGASAMEARIVDATVVVSPGTDGRTNCVVLDVDVIDADRGRDRRTTYAGRQPTRTADQPAARAVASCCCRSPPPCRRRCERRRRRGRRPLGRSRASAPANEVEANLLAAASSAKTDNFLSTLLLAKVLIPIPTGESADVRPDDPAFPWRREVVDGQAYLVVFTSPERMTRVHGRRRGRGDREVRPADPVLAGRGLGVRGQPGHAGRRDAARRADQGAGRLGRRRRAHRRRSDSSRWRSRSRRPPPPSTSTIIMQKPIAPSQVDYYLERGLRPGLRLRAPGHRGRRTCTRRSRSTRRSACPTPARRSTATRPRSTCCAGRRTAPTSTASRTAGSTRPACARCRAG